MITKFADGSYETSGVFSTLEQLRDLLDMPDIVIVQDVLSKKLQVVDYEDCNDFQELLKLVSSKSFWAYTVYNDEIHRYVTLKKFRTEEVFQEIRSLRVEMHHLTEQFQQITLYMIRNLESYQEIEAQYTIADIHNMFPQIAKGTISNHISKNKYREKGIDKSVINILNYQVRFAKVNGKWRAENIDIVDVNHRLRDYDSRRKLKNSLIQNREAREAKC